MKLSDVLKQITLGVTAAESFTEDKVMPLLQPKAIKKAVAQVKVPEIPSIDLNKTAKTGRKMFDKFSSAVYAASANAGLVKRPPSRAVPAASVALAALAGLAVFDIVRHQRAKA